MSTITICRDHDLPKSDCDDALAELTTYLQGLGADVTQTGDRLTFDGRGFDGEVRIRPGEARGTIRLGLLARPFRRQLESEINRQLDARLGVQ